MAHENNRIPNHKTQKESISKNSGNKGFIPERATSKPSSVQPSSNPKK